VNNCYMLTDLTGRNANKERSQVTAGMQIKRSTFRAVLVGLVPGLLLTALLLPFLGAMAVFFGLPIGVGATMFFLADAGGDNVSSQRYKGIVAKAKNGRSEFTLCWGPLNVGSSEFFLVPRTAAAVRDSDR
jgi:hypothetical protein